VNEAHTPSPSEERALEVLKDGRDEGRPWGRVNPMFLREAAGMKKSTAEYALRQLHTAGWVQKPADGLYEFVDDPRDD
jgi:DNA-binding IclR family transcriptional regulator